MYVDGGCHCGRVKFEADVDPDAVALCHCSDCQHLTGSAYRVTASVPRQSFVLIAGEPKLYVKSGANGRKRLQFFCGECGSPIYTTGQGEDANKVGVRVGSINQRHELRPRLQIWCSSALPWVDEIGALPRRDRD